MGMPSRIRPIRRRIALTFVLVASATVALLAASCSSEDKSSTASQDGRVSFANQCEVPPSCGGDFTGKWRLVGGCVQPPSAGFECPQGVSQGRGTATGTFTFSESDFDSTTDTELRQCGWVDSSGDGAGGSLTVQGNQLVLGGGRTLTFCVEGTTLWLYDAAAEYPDLRVLRLVRDGDGG